MSVVVRYRCLACTSSDWTLGLQGHDGGAHEVLAPGANDDSAHALNKVVHWEAGIKWTEAVGPDL